jgi:flagellar biosynthesis/type III secretory pathway protein FliH
VYFDTLTVTENLITAGMPDGQAKAIAKEYANLMQHQVDQFSTKDDINRLDTKIDTKVHELDMKIDAKFHELDTKINTKFHELDTKVDTKFHELDAKIDTKFHELDTKIDTKFDVWMWRMMFNMWGIAATVAGLLFTALRFF